MGFYWPNMSKGADLVQTQCETCHLAIDKEESYTVFATEDSRCPFMGYLAEEILKQKHGERYKLRKLAAHYFLHEGILFKKGYNRDPLWCLRPKEASKMLQEVHARECEEH